MSQENEFHQKIIELIEYHEKRKNAYDWVYHKTVALDAYSTSFKKFAVHLMETRVSDVDSNEKRANALNDASIPLSTSQEIMRAENVELTELTGFLQTLQAHTGSIIALSWRDDLNEISKQNFKLPFPDPEDNRLFMEQFIIIKNEERILRELFNAQKLLRKASELGENIDLAPALFHYDLTGPRQLPRFLFAVSELIAEGATTTRSVAELIQANESCWREFNYKARQLGIQSSEYKKANALRDHLDLDDFLNIISEWAHENLLQALFEFKENKEGFKFKKVVEISKVWIQNDPRYDLRSVDAVIEYESGEIKKRNVSFQIDATKKVVGFNLYEPIRG